MQQISGFTMIFLRSVKSERRTQLASGIGGNEKMECKPVEGKLRQTNIWTSLQRRVSELLNLMSHQLEPQDPSHNVTETGTPLGPKKTRVEHSFLRLFVALISVQLRSVKSSCI